MPDWLRLRQAYGSAEDIPGLLDLLSPDVKAPVWHELWSRICHQGTVYSASFPVLPYLLAAASKWPPSQRAMPLGLASAIVASWDVKGPRDRLIAEYLPVVGELHKLTLDTLASGLFARNDYVHLLQAALAFLGDRLWGHELERIIDTEFEGRCAHCEADFYIVVEDVRFFCTAEDWVKPPAVRREQPISPCAPAQLPPVGIWLHNECVSHSQAGLAVIIRHLFGRSICPSCGRNFQVPDAIEKWRDAWPAA